MKTEQEWEAVDELTENPYTFSLTNEEVKKLRTFQSMGTGND